MKFVISVILCPLYDAVLRKAISDLSETSQTKDLNFATKALPTLINVLAKAQKLGLNEAVGCLDFAINFPTTVAEVMKRVTRLSLIFYTHPKSYYEVSLHFI